MPKLRVLLADDHAMLRDGLSMFINGQPDMSVVAQATTGREAVALAKSTASDVAVLDTSMPDMLNGGAAEAIVASCPGIRVIALTGHADDVHLRRLLQAGANGYVVKSSAADALISAIRMVARGGTYMEPQRMGNLLSSGPTGSAKACGGSARLSLREEEVLNYIAWGLSNKEIAAQLGLSIKTVESYKASGTDKLQLHSRADIVRYAAVLRGWLSQDRVPDSPPWRTSPAAGEEMQSGRSAVVA